MLTVGQDLADAGLQGSGGTCGSIQTVHGELRKGVCSIREIHGAVEPVLEGHIL